MATIKEIAKLAGVSRGTVDRVLNKRGNVKAETAERVLKITQSLNYSPNLAGKTLAVRKKHLCFGYILFSYQAANPFFDAVTHGIESRAQELLEYGVTVEIRSAQIDRPEIQIALIDELLALGIDGLAITPINHPDVAARIKALTASGIPVVTANSDIRDSGRIAYVGSDYFKSGVTAAGLMNLVTGGKANVGITIGHPWVECHTERAAGFAEQVTACYPDIRIVGTVVNNDDDQESFAVVQSLLQANPEINALFLVSAGVVGACRAVKNLRLLDKVKIISFDLPPSTQELIEQDIIAATITQQPMIQGSKPLDILLDYIGMGIEPETEWFYTKIGIKIKENL